MAEPTSDAEARTAERVAGPRSVPAVKHLRYAPIDAWAEGAVRTLCGTSRAPGGPTAPEADVDPHETTNDVNEATCDGCLVRAERQWWQ